MVGGVRGNASGGNGFTYIEADLNGRFRFAHLRPGNYDVHAVPAVASLLPRWKQPVHLSRYKPVRKTTVQVGSEKSAGELNR